MDKRPEIKIFRQIDLLYRRIEKAKEVKVNRQTYKETEIKK